MAHSMCICAGPRATEAAVLAEVEALAGEAERDPLLLARPVRVVVPSQSLRDHLAMAWMQRRGRSAAGVVIETLYTLALGVLERAGEGSTRGGVALELFARRFAASQPSLAALGELEDGRGAVVASIADLLDAGLTPDHLAAVRERLDDLPRRGLAHAAEVRRAMDIAAVAAATAEAFTRLGLARSGMVLARAAALLATRPGLLPARAVIIHGYANATGLALDLLETLGRTHAARTFLDLPADPGAEGELAGPEFAARLALRLGGRPLAELARGRGPEAPAAELRVLTAASPAAEVRAAVAAVRELLARGVVPETIGVVARDLAPYRLALASAFRRAALPFSAPSAEAAPAGGERRLAAFRALVRPRERAALATHLAALERLARQSQGGETLAALEAALGWLERELPAELPVESAELELLLEHALAESRDRPLGGRGGGVQVLSATEARGRTFEHLFLLGLNRHLFPRRVSSDALLPDPLRLDLRTVLPDLPVKAEGHAEERYLFAQLLAAAPAVTLSQHQADEAGAPRAPSPLLVRLRLAGLLAPPERPPRSASPEALAEPDLPLWEGAALAALGAGREALRRLLPLALPAPLAAFRCRLIDEVDPDLSTAEGRLRARRLGPFFGFLGGQSEAEGIFVTELEALARCGWQAFLERGLRLAPPREREAARAGLDPLLVGQVVHAVTERWAKERGRPVRQPLAEALAAGASAVPWLTPAELVAWARHAAEEVAAAHGLPLLAHPLALRAGLFLEVAGRELGPVVHLVGAELEGEVLVVVPGGEARVRFRADLAEETDRGPRLTDLKSGRPPRLVQDEGKRLSALVKEIEAGLRLQVAAYAGAAGATGRYLFLGRPELVAERRELALPAGDAAAATALASITATLFAVRRAGAHLPRLKDGSLEKQGPACERCAVFEACSQHDSVASERLRRFIEAARRGEAPASPVEAAALAAFELGNGAAAEESEP